jgi:ribonuclease VapC
MVVDSSALVGVLFEEPWSGACLNALLLSGTKVMSAFTLFESTVVVEARKGVAGRLALESFCAALEIEVAPFTAQHARVAHEAWRRFGKGRHEAGLDLGDCCAYALARAAGLPLLAKGDDFPKTDIQLVSVESGGESGDTSEGS